MLSWPPCSFAQRTRWSAAAAGSGWPATAAAAVLASSTRLGQGDGRRGVVPQAVAADQHPAGPVQPAGGDVRPGVQRVRPEPAGDRVRRRVGLGLGPIDARGDHLRAERVVDGELLAVPGVGEPVGPGVAAPPDRERRRRRPPRRRTCTTAARTGCRARGPHRPPRCWPPRQPPSSAVDERSITAASGSSGPAASPAASRSAHAARAAASAARSLSGAVVTPSHTTSTPRWPSAGGGEGHRVLVAGVGDALVAHTSDPRRRRLAPVVPLAERALPAGPAEPVLEHLTPARRAAPHGDAGGHAGRGPGDTAGRLVAGRAGHARRGHHRRGQRAGLQRRPAALAERVVGVGRRTARRARRRRARPGGPVGAHAGRRHRSSPAPGSADPAGRRHSSVLGRMSLARSTRRTRSRWSSFSRAASR